MSPFKDILYIMLLAQGKVVTLIRPRRHSIHPAGSLSPYKVDNCWSRLRLDIHILLNTVHSPSIANSPASSSWIPICLPKFNPSGFVNAYVSFLRNDDIHEAQAGEHVSGAEDATDSRSPNSPRHNMKFFHTSDQRRITLLCISGGGDLDTVRTWCDTVTQVQFISFSIRTESHRFTLTATRKRQHLSWHCWCLWFWTNGVFCLRSGHSRTATFRL